MRELLKAENVPSSEGPPVGPHVGPGRPPVMLVMTNKKSGGLGWWIGWMFAGFLVAVGLSVVLMHVANSRVEKQREYRDECFKWGPRDADGDPICDRDLMPSYTSSGPYFTPPAGAPSGS